MAHLISTIDNLLNLTTWPHTRMREQDFTGVYR